MNSREKHEDNPTPKKKFHAKTPRCKGAKLRSNSQEQGPEMYFGFLGAFAPWRLGVKLL
jgi:hypothetical protein